MEADIKERCELLIAPPVFVYVDAELLELAPPQCASVLASHLSPLSDSVFPQFSPSPAASIR